MRRRRVRGGKRDRGLHHFVGERAQIEHAVLFEDHGPEWSYCSKPCTASPVGVGYPGGAPDPCRQRRGVSGQHAELPVAPSIVNSNGACSRLDMNTGTPTAPAIAS